MSDQWSVSDRNHSQSVLSPVFFFSTLWLSFSFMHPALSLLNVRIWSVGLCWTHLSLSLSRCLPSFGDFVDLPTWMSSWWPQLASGLFFHLHHKIGERNCNGRPVHSFIFLFCWSVVLPELTWMLVIGINHCHHVLVLRLHPYYYFVSFSLVFARFWGGNVENKKK